MVAGRRQAPSCAAWEDQCASYWLCCSSLCRARRLWRPSNSATISSTRSSSRSRFRDQDGWVSEGWISVAPKGCQTDSKHVDLTEFYWRGETDWIKTKGGRTQWSWGKDRQFS